MADKTDDTRDPSPTTPATVPTEEPKKENGKRTINGKICVKVLQGRNLTKKNQYCIIDVDGNQKFTQVVKSTASPVWKDETHNFKVNKDVDIVVTVMAKGTFGNRIAGLVTIPLNTVIDPPHPRNSWYPVQPRPGKKVKPGKQFGDLNLEFSFTDTAPKQVVFHGLSIEDQWTAETSGGDVTKTSTWAKNPQFLLTVKSEAKLKIVLSQPEGATQKGTFFITTYEDYNKGRSKVVLNTATDIIKIDNFLSPVYGVEAEATVELERGNFVIIPCPEEPGHTGPFKLQIQTPHLDDLSLKKLPYEADWKETVFSGEWKGETAAGGVLRKRNWWKNPQYLITALDDTELCVVLSQPEKEASIGLYIFKYDGHGKKMIDFKEKIAETDSFKHACTVGLGDILMRKGETWLIVPCTYEPGVEGPFWLRLYTAAGDIEAREMKATWQHQPTFTTQWSPDSAGGCPNLPTFTHNPQLYLTFAPPTQLLIELTQESDELTTNPPGIGFWLLKAKNGKQRYKQGEITKGDLLCQPDGWLKEISVLAYANVENPENASAILIPSTFDAGITKRFTVTVHSDKPVEIEELPQQQP